MPKATRLLLAALALGTALLLAGGIWFYQAQERLVSQRVETELRSIARLKADQIAAWRKEQTTDAAVLVESPFLIEAGKRCLREPRPEELETMLAGFRSLQRHHHYLDILLADTQGEIRMALHSAPGSLHPQAVQALSEALASGRPVLTDLHAGPGALPSHLDVIAPLFPGSEATSTALGAVVLQVDAAQFLYPLIRSWPTPSRTAETLLVRRDGDSVLFLNELRHRTRAANELRIPLSRTDVPAVMAVLGRTGVVHGTDYRGVEVLSAIEAVPDSPWFLVAKVDEAEAFSEWRFRSLSILALLVTLLAAAAGLSAAIWQRTRKSHYRSLFLAEAARRRSEERHHATLISVGDGVIVADAEARVEMLNPVAETLTGWPRQEARGRHLDEVFRIVNEETRQPVESPAGRVVREGEVVGLANHTLLVARDGSERPIADSGAPIRDENGRVTGVVLVFRDQSAERAAQRALLASESRFRVLFEKAPIPYQALDSQGNILQVNNAWLEQLGYRRDEVIGRWFGDFLAGESRDSFPERFRRYLEEGEQHGVEVEMRRRDGGTMIAAFEGKVARWEDGEFLQTHGVFINVTERKRAEAERDRLVAAIEQAAEAIVITDAGGAIVYVNRAFEALTGYTRREALGRNPRILKSDLQDEAFYRQLWHTLKGGRTWQGRMVNRRKNGTLYTQEATISPVCDPAGAIVHYVAVNHDLTDHLRLHEERDRLEEQFRQAQKMEAVGRLAGGVAHDFNNMLTVISGCAEIALSLAGREGRLPQLLREILKAAQHSADLTRQLLAFARRQTVEPRVLDLNETVAGMLPMLRRLIGEEIDLAWTPGLDLGSVRVDPSQIEQILANLAVNARDAINGVGKITIGTSNAEIDERYCARHPGFLAGSYVVLAVSDDGSGMDKETLSHIFEPFFTTKEVGEGTGLGLATVHGIVKQNDGFIHVYSEPGQGTTFRVYLSRHTAAAEQAPEASTSRPTGRGSETVLLVEDEPALLELGQEILQAQGYQVLAAGTPGEAISLAAGYPGPIRLLITDVVMPEMNGRQLAAKLAATIPGLKCLFMSGYTSETIAHRGVLEPGVRFIQKPFPLRELADKVREALDGS